MDFLLDAILVKRFNWEKHKYWAQRRLNREPQRHRSRSAPSRWERQPR